MIDLSIIIVNYNTNTLTIQCIESVYASIGKELSFEIIVIDNQSTREHPELIKEKCPGISLLQCKDNLGFGRANNLGIHLSKGRYILLLNSDTLIVENALVKCVKFMDSEFASANNIGLMGCKLLNADLSFQNSTFEKSNMGRYMISSNVLLNHIFSSFRKKVNRSESRFVGAVSGAFMLFRNEVFEKIQPFDPDFFLYSEETELCRQRLARHYRIYYWNEASIIHLGGGSSKSETYLQHVVSYALSWYKKGQIRYLVYIFWTTINFITNVMVVLFVKRRTRLAIYREMRSYVHSLPYLFREIPKYPKHWGARPAPLKLSEKH